MSESPQKTHKTFDGLTQFWSHDSSSTRTPMQFSTFIPHGEVAGCVIFLSGLTCTPENFMIKAGAQKYFAQHHLMLLCPDTSPRGLQLPHEHDAYDFGSGASFYLNATTPGYADHYKMETYVASELHALIVDRFTIAPDRISLMGHSMGGHGALMLGLRAPQKFRSLSTFSPIAHPTRAPWGKKAFAGYFGDDHAAALSHDATALVTTGKRHPHEILIDCGTDDEYLASQLHIDDFTAACRQAGQPLSTNFRAGYDHSYYFIATFVESHIAFHAAALRT